MKFSSPAEQLAAVERTLDDMRWAREKPDTLEHQTYHAMKALAVRLRGETPKEAGKVLRQMADRVGRARADKEQFGGVLSGGPALAISEALIGRWWAVVKPALERYEAALEAENKETAA